MRTACSSAAHLIVFKLASIHMWLPLGNLLKKNISGRPIRTTLDAVMAAESARGAVLAVFPKYANRIRVSSVKNGILWLTSSCRPAQQELAMSKRKLLQACQERQLPIREIRIGHESAPGAYPEGEPDLD